MQKKLQDHLYKLYIYLERVPMVAGMIHKISYLLETLKPQDEYMNKVQTMQTALAAFSAGMCVLLVAGSLLGITGYGAGMAVILTSLLIHFLVMGRLEREELKVLKQFSKYCGEVRHYYHRNGTVEEAIFDSLEAADYEISLHMNRIYDFLIQDEPGMVEEYKETAPCKYLVTFLALCHSTITYGDTLRQEKSLFLTNLNYLKQEVETEILKREKTKHVFSGLTFLVLMPVFFLKQIERFGTVNLPDLEKYYEGGYGIAVSCLIFVATLSAYQLVCYLGKTMETKTKEYHLLEAVSRITIVDRLIGKWCFYHPLKAKDRDGMLKKTGEGMNLRQYLVLVGLIGICSFITGNALILHSVAASRHNAIYQSGDVQGVVYANKKQDLAFYQKIVSNQTAALIHKEQDRISFGKIQKGITRENGINPYIAKILTKEVERRLVLYHSAHYRIWYALVVVGFSILLAGLPRSILLCKGYFQKMEMENEVIQFHTIILMLMYLPRMNALILLEWMEHFGDIFHSAIAECVDHFSYDEERALRRLMEQEGYLPFVRIIQNLQACDKVGVERAFDELMGQREFYLEKRKQDNEILLINKAVIGKLLAYLPAILTIGLYLIIPFVLESMRMLMENVAQMGQL